MTRQQVLALSRFWTLLTNLQKDLGWDEYTTRVNLNKPPPFLFGGAL